jgi:hypothetical protein
VVDIQGNVYVTDGGSNRVLKLAAGASALEDDDNCRVLELTVQ